MYFIYFLKMLSSSVKLGASVLQVPLVFHMLFLVHDSIYMPDLFQIPTKCESGCVCAPGLYEKLDGTCVSPEECPCEYGGISYEKGEEINTGCNTW